METNDDVLMLYNGQDGFVPPANGQGDVPPSYESEYIDPSNNQSRPNGETDLVYEAIDPVVDKPLVQSQASAPHSYDPSYFKRPQLPLPEADTTAGYETFPASHHNSGENSLDQSSHVVTRAPPLGYELNQGSYVHPQHQRMLTFVTQVTVTRSENKSTIRAAIPEFPMGFAIFLCVMNCLFSGFGTLIAAFGVICCGNIGQSKVGRVGTFFINFWVGLAQMALATFIVGWVWSIIWGVGFIAMSGKSKETKEVPTTMTSLPVPNRYRLPNVNQI